MQKFPGVRAFMNKYLEAVMLPLLKKFTCKVDGFTFVHFYPKMMTSYVKVLDDPLILYLKKVLPSKRGCVTLKPSGKSALCEHLLPLPNNSVSECFKALYLSRPGFS